MMKFYAKLACRVFPFFLIITSFLVSCTESPVIQSPVAQFELNQDIVEIDQPIKLNDKSIGEVETWSWDFGDGNTSSAQSTVHTYNQPVSYTIVLTVSNKASSNSTSSVINVVEPLVAEFSASKTKVLIGEEIEFTDESTGNIDERLWDFGDNTTSMQWQPKHSYDAPGVYTVSLKVSNADRSDINIKKDYIVVTPLFVKTMFSSNVTEMGEYTPEEDDAFEPGEDIWVICKVTGFDQHETEAGYEVWLKVREVKVNGSYIPLDEKSAIEVHDINPTLLEVVELWFYVGRYYIAGESNFGLGSVEAIIEDVISGSTVIAKRGFLIEK